jgi:hypothetical protein
VTLGDLENNIEAWAKSLPLNNLIVSMVDKQAMTQSEKLCDPWIFWHLKSVQTNGTFE